jgi:hypothetical protein
VTDGQDTMHNQKHGKVLIMSNELNVVFLVLKYELDDFFNATNQQITRITSTQVSNLTANVSQLEKRFVRIKICDYFYLVLLTTHSPKLNGKNLTLTDVCSVAPHVADKMSQSKAKVFIFISL